MRRSVDELEEGTTVGGEEGGCQSDPGTVGLDGATSHSPIWKSLVRDVAKTLLYSEKSAYLQSNQLCEDKSLDPTKRLFQNCKMFEPT